MIEGQQSRQGFPLAHNTTEHIEQELKYLGFLKQQGMNRRLIKTLQTVFIQRGINMALRTHLNTVNEVTAVYISILTYFFGIIQWLIEN
jgi:hypothetical protein